MQDKDKLNEELSEEQLNKAAGGIIKNYTCEGCKHDLSGRPGGNINGKLYCPTCYQKTIEEIKKTRPTQPGLR